MQCLKLVFIAEGSSCSSVTLLVVSMEDIQLAVWAFWEGLEEQAGMVPATRPIYAGVVKGNQVWFGVKCAAGFHPHLAALGCQ